MGLDFKYIAKKTLNNKIDELELAMLNNLNPINCPLEHIFTDGVYVRKITMPKGALITSKIHKTQHPYFILKGEAIVWIDGVETIVKAPFAGVTEAGTRRVLYILKKCIWATTHANPDNETVEQIEERIIEKHDNPHLSLEIQKRLSNLLNK